MKKLLGFDWLRAVQLKQKVKCQRKLHIVTLDYDWLKDNMSFSKPMISRKTTTKILE